MKKGYNHPKQVDEILDQQINTAIHEYRRSNFRLLVSAFSAGLEVGFSVFLIGALYSLFHGELSSATLHIILAFAYPIGFIFVVIGRSELFTEHTTMAILPVLNGSSNLKSLLVLWGIILTGNLTGGFLFSLLLVDFTTAMDIIKPEAFAYLAEHLIHYSWNIILVSAIFAGWLMGLLSWLLASVSDSSSQIIVVILVTATIGIGGLHHSIVGSIEVFSGMLVSPKITFADYLSFEICSIVGNAIGGVFFVGIVKYGQKSDKIEE
ncbi:formate/nitrite transporter family protein [Microscilla marina]|uniref:Formate/nitrite transporter family n=1 Tax=Microscilla marina ATCC 23134 TaxID=313606 RepID=A1ZPK3_MICM2|nr:formate/nitrite transporter family protein [Microscilla marina]EAY27742.1 formate/nitrite transporter family [Microscilla marina ATCC 23134]